MLNVLKGVHHIRPLAESSGTALDKLGSHGVRPVFVGVPEAQEEDVVVVSGNKSGRWVGLCWLKQLDL